MSKKISIKSFRPATASVKSSVDDLLARGGVLIESRESLVRILRQQSVATIDAYGRVQWAPATHQDMRLR